MTTRAILPLAVAVWAFSGCAVAMPYIQQASQKSQIREAAGQGTSNNARLEVAGRAFRDLGAVNAKVAPLAFPQINAASVGDGHFFVTDGLLNIDNKCLLWGIVAHELAHDQLRHADAKVNAAAGVGVLSTAASIVPGGGIIVGLAGAGGISAYGRSQEVDADARAAHILSQAGKPTWSLRYSFDFMTAVSGDTGGGWLTSHPMTSARMVQQPDYDSDQVAVLCPSESVRADQIASTKAAIAKWQSEAQARADQKAEEVRKLDQETNCVVNRPC